MNVDRVILSEQDKKEYKAERKKDMDEIKKMCDKQKTYLDEIGKTLSNLTTFIEDTGEVLNELSVTVKSLKNNIA